jgi:hypothetical protein
MVIFFIVSFSSLTTEIGGGGPIGLVRESIQNIGQGKPVEDSTKGVWVVHIGGDRSPDNPISGLSIPFFVLLGGVLGGYIRATKQDGVFSTLTSTLDSAEIKEIIISKKKVEEGKVRKRLNAADKVHT